MANNALLDMFSGDGFTMASLTAAINDFEHIPSRAGRLVFAHSDVLKPIETTKAVIEREGEVIKLVPTSARGSRGDTQTADKRTLLELEVPHIPVTDTIYADSIMGVREFGTSNELATIESAVNKRLLKMARRLDFTLEHHRLGALKGIILDADGATVLTDLYSAFGFLNADGLAQPETFDFDLDSLATVSDNVRIKSQDVTRYMRRNANTILPSDARVWAFCGDNFFDKLISRDDVKDAWRATDAAAERLGGNYAFGTFEFGGIVWENYRGSNNGIVSIADDEARFFWAGVPELYTECYAPADYIETVNTPGLPRYAKAAPDVKFGKFVELEAQTNPLPLCLKPATLCRGVTGSSS